MTKNNSRSRIEKVEHNFFGFLIISVGILIFIFTYNEDTDFDKAFNPNKVAAFGSILGSVLTAYTVFLLFKQTLQNSQERRDAAIADLHPANVVFSIDYEKSKDFFIYYTRQDFARQEHHRENIKMRFDIYNLGLKAAKEIQLFWLHDEEEIDKFFNEVGINNYYGHYQSFDFIPAEKSILVEPLYQLRKMDKFCIDNLTHGTFKNIFLVIEYKDIYSNKYIRHFKTSVSSSHTYSIIEFKSISEERFNIEVKSFPNMLRRYKDLQKKHQGDS